MSALRTHYVEISQHADNADGSLSVTAIARRSGIMRYRSDSGDRLEFVPPELIDARDDQGRPIMGMLAGAPNTNEHPAQIIRYSTDSRKAVQVGKVNEEIHIFNDADGERSVKVRFDVEDPETIEDIRSGRKKGVSLGYLCNVIKEDGEYRGQKYTHKQAMPFSIDHLAIVANPRNPGALITRFDSDDVAVISMDTARSPIEVIRVDGCCAACSAKSDDDEDEEQKAKKKKVKTDGDDLPMIGVTFGDRVYELSTAQATALWEDGTVDRVRLDGKDYFVSTDVALSLADQGLIHEDAFISKAGIKKGGGKCGRGWVGVKGSCERGKASDQGAALKRFSLKQRGEKYGVQVNPSPQQKKKLAKTELNKAERNPQKLEEGPIKSQKAFSDEALKAAKELDRDHNMDNLIPIHKLRAKIGERVTRSQFSDWLNEMQAQDKVQLIGGEMPSLTPEIAANSVKTNLGAPRYYLKILEKPKNDAEDISMTPVTFHHSTIPVSTSDLRIMIEGGIVQPVRFDGRDFFVSMDIAIGLRNDAVIGGACGPGWEGSRGNCQRKKRNIGAIARKVGAAALVGGAAVYLGNKIAKNPKKAAAVGAAAVGAGVLFRGQAKKAIARVEDRRASKARDITLENMRENLQKKKSASLNQMRENVKKYNATPPQRRNK